MQTTIQIATAAGKMLSQGYHCSEAVYWAGTQLYPEKISPELQKLATPFAGGVGGTNDGLCGALTGGILVIGALYGREDGDTNDKLCQDLAAAFYRKFQEAFQHVICRDIKAGWRKEFGHDNCENLVRETVLILANILEKTS